MDRTLESAEEPNLKAIAFDTVQNYVIEPAESRGEIQRIEQPIIHFTTYGIDEGISSSGGARTSGVGRQVFRLKNVEKGLWILSFNLSGPSRSHSVVTAAKSGSRSRPASNGGR